MIQPTTRTAALRFLEEREPIVGEHHELLGLGEQDARAFTEATRRARAAYDEMVQARQRLAEAKARWHQTADSSLKTGWKIMQLVRRAARHRPDRERIESLAMIEHEPPRAARQRPRVPAGLAVRRDRQDRVRLRWQGSTAGGAVFVVQRRVTDAQQLEGAWVTIAQTTERTLIDEHAPLDAALVEYRLRAERLAGVSNYAQPVAAPPPARGAAANPVGTIEPKAGLSEPEARCVEPEEGSAAAVADALLDGRRQRGAA